MGLSIHMQDRLLNWFRGRPMGLTPDMLWLSFHSAYPASGMNETSALFGGRLALLPSELAEPVTGNAGLREITNTRALVSQPVSSQQTLAGLGVWDAQLGGNLLLAAVYDPELVVEAGNPHVLLVGQLRLRATA